jgi:hypothetical protein
VADAPTHRHPLRLRPSEPLAVPLSTWDHPDPEVQRAYLEPGHAKAVGRGTAIQRQYRAGHPGGAVRGLLNAVVGGGRRGPGAGMGG